jgi:hypothetical protein
MSRSHPDSILPTIAAASAGTLDATQNPPTRRWMGSMAQNLVTSLFQPMSQGHLRMVHPDGSFLSLIHI